MPRRPDNPPPELHATGEFVPSRWPLVRLMSEMKSESEAEAQKIESETEAPEIGDEDSKEKEKTATVFERFVSALKEQLAKERTKTVGGTALTWKEFPLEEALADGLWVLMIKAGEKAKHKLGTDQDASDASHLIGHFLEVGMLLQYQTPEAAAADFLQKIPPIVDAEMTKKTSDQPFVAADAWRLPVAQFFAPLIKRVQQAGEETMGLKKILDVPVTVDEDRDINLYRGLGGVAANPEDIMIETAWGKKFSSPGAYIEEYDKYQEEKIEFAACKNLPYQTNKIPPDVYTGSTFISEHWLYTQLCLAVADLPDREYLISTEFLPAMEAIKDLSEEEVQQKFCARMKRRNPQFPPSEGTSSLVHHVFPFLSAMSLGGGDFSNLISNFYIQIDFEAFALGSTLARDVATVQFLEAPGELEAVGYAIRNQTGEKKRKAIEKLCAAIDWQTISQDDVKKMCAADLVPLPVIVDGVASMTDPSVQASAAQRILERKPPAAIIKKMRDLQLYKPEANLNLKNIETLSESERNDEIQRYLAYKTTDSGEERILKENMRQLLLHSTHESIQELFDDPKSRYIMVREFDDAIVPFDTPNRGSKTGKALVQELQQLNSLVGNELMAKWILSAELFNLISIYTRFRDQEATPWHQLDTKGDIPTRLKSLKIDTSYITKALDTLTDEEIFLWFHEQFPDVKERLADYIKNKNEYIELHKSAGKKKK